MKFYHFGNPDNQVIFLLPGTCCHWKLNFGQVIDKLKSSYHVVCVSYDGFDETENTLFTSMLDETEKIENYILTHFDGKIDIAYGCSLGGSFVGLLIQRKKIHIQCAVLGSSDLDQDNPFIAKLKCLIAVPLLYKIITTGQYPKLLQGLMEKKRTPYRDQFMKMFNIGLGGLPYIKKESIRNQFYSDLITPLEKKISAEKTTVHCFYASKMGNKYLERYKYHFDQPIIHQFNMEHEELLVLHPQIWVEEIHKCTAGEHYETSRD